MNPLTPQNMGRPMATKPNFPGLIDLLVLNSRRSPESINADADLRLCEVVRHAYDSIPFYRETWRRAGFDPRHFRGAIDLPNIPFVDKAMIVDAGDAAVDARVPRELLQSSSTSGTSGRSITVHRINLETRVARRALLRQLVHIGARPWHPFLKMASSWLESRQGKFIQRVCKTRHLPPEMSLEDQLRALDEFPAKGLIGQTGGIYLLARELIRRGRTHPLRFVVTTGATLYDEMRESVRTAFCTEPSDMYGAIEVGGVSWQCRRGNYHIDTDRVIVEIVDEHGRPLPPGKKGQVVVTALFAWTQPFIRYRLFDVSALSTRTCECGVRFPLMEPVLGRVNDFIPTPAGDLVTPHFFFHIFDHSGANPVKEWRLIQEDRTHLTYEYIPESPFNQAAFDHGMNEIRKRMGTGCVLRTVQVDSVPMGVTGKRNCIVSRLRPGFVAPDKPWVGEAAVGASALAEERVAI